MNSFLVNVGRHQLSDLGVDGIVCVNYLVYLTLASSAERLCSSSKQRAFTSFSLSLAIWQVFWSKSYACFLEIVSCSKKLFSHSFEICFTSSSVFSVSWSLAFIFLFSTPNLRKRSMKAWI